MSTFQRPQSLDFIPTEEQPLPPDILTELRLRKLQVSGNHVQQLLATDNLALLKQQDQDAFQQRITSGRAGGTIFNDFLNIGGSLATDLNLAVVRALRLGKGAIGFGSPSRRELLKDMGEGFAFSLEDLDEALVSQTTDFRQGLVGNVGITRTIGRFTIETGLMVAQFVGAAAVPGGIPALVGLQSNSIGVEVFDESGSLTQGTVAAAIHFATTMTIFKFGGASLKKAFGKGRPSRKELEALGNMLVKGRITNAAESMFHVLKIVPTTAALRNVEQVLNSLAQNMIQPAHRIERFELTYENFVATTKAGLEEGAVFALLPVATKGIAAGIPRKHIREAKRIVRLGEAAEVATRTVHAVNSRLNRGTPKEQQELLDRLDAVETENPLFILLREGVREQIGAEKKAPKPKEEVKEEVKEEEKEQTLDEKSEELEEFAGLMETTVGVDAEGGNIFAKDRTIEPTEKDLDLADRQRVASRPEEAKRREKDSILRIKRRKEEPEDFDVRQAEKLSKEQKATELEASEIEAESNVVISQLVGFKADVVVKEIKARIEELGAEESTPQTERTIKALKDSLKIFEETISQKREVEAVEGKVELPAERPITVKGKTVTVADAIKLLGRQKRTMSSEESAQKEALVKQLQKDLESKDASPRKLANLLREERDGKAPTIKKILREAGKEETKLSTEELEAAIKLRERAAARTEQKKSQNLAIRQAKLMIDDVIRTVRREAKLLKKEGRERVKVFKDFLAGLDKNLKRDAGINEIVLKRDAKGREVIDSVEELTRAIADVQTRLDNQITKNNLSRIENATNQRNTNTSSFLSPTLDSTLTSIIRIVNPKQAEKLKLKDSDVNKALDEYVESRARLFDRPADEVRVEQEIAAVKEILAKAKNEGMDSLDVGESSVLAQFIEGLRAQNTIRRASEKKALKEEADKNADLVLEEFITAQGGKVRAIDRDPVTGKIIASRFPLAGLSVQLVKDLSFGLRFNGRLADIVEFLSGGDRTVAHKILYKDIVSAQREAMDLQMNFHSLWSKVWKEHGVKDIADSLFNPKIKGREETVVIKMPEGTPDLVMTMGEVVGYRMSATDPGTRADLLNKKGGIYLEGREKGVDHSKAEHDIIMEQTKDTPAARLADANIDFINRREVVKLVQRYGLENFGIDFIVNKEGNYVPSRKRSRKVDRKKEEERAQETPADLFEAVGRNLGIERGQPAIGDRSIVKTRTGVKTKDVVIRDGFDIVSDYIHAVSILTTVEVPLRKAESLLKNPEIQELFGSRKGNTRGMFNDISSVFYSEMKRRERSFTTRFNTAETMMRRLRNNIVTANLAFNPIIGMYQPVSILGAVAYWGKEGVAAELSTSREFLFRSKGNRFAEVNARMLAKSGYAWRRRAVGNAFAIANAELVAGRNKTVFVAGKKYGRESAGMFLIMEADNFAITSIYRMAEIIVAKRFERDGRSIEKEQELYDEMVKQEFADAVDETQPTFDPTSMNGMTVRATTTSPENRSIAYNYLGMFRGFVSKLNALQARGIMRARVEYARGNLGAAAKHISYAASLTVPGTLMIPIIRNVAKAGLVTGLGLAFGVEQDFGKTGLETAERTAIDEIGQIAGISLLGDLISDAITSFTLEQPIKPEFSPATATFTQAVRSFNQVVNTDPNNRTGMENLIVGLNAARAVQSGAGITTFPNSILIRFARDVIKKDEARRKKERGGTRK